MKILQITDPHLYGSAAGALRGVVTDASLRSVLDEAYAEVPDFEAAAGDRRSGAGRSVRLFAFPQHFRQLDKPVLCIPGKSR